MRAWTLRHPNLMVVWWAVVFVYFLLRAITRLDDRQWGWAAVSIVAAFFAFDRLKHWWSRT